MGILGGGAKVNLALRILSSIAAGVFIYAGALKAIDPMRFANDIDNYHMLPWAISVRLAFYLPWLEIFCGLAVIVRRLHLGALVMLAGMTTAFIVASVIAKSRGLDVSCGCFGHAGKTLTFARHLAIDFALLAVFAISLWREKRAAASPV